MENNILKQVDDYMKVKSVEMAIKEFSEHIPAIVSLNKNIYDEMISKGFDKEQALNFSNSFILKMVFDVGK